jgi:hypothetical protein
LRSRNTGPIEATDIRGRVNGKPVAESDHVLGGEDGVTLLGPGSQHEYMLYVTAMGPPPLFEVETEWQDASGIPGVFRTQFRAS